MTIIASDPFLGRRTISRDGFVFVLTGYPANQDCLDEHDPGQYWDACCRYGVDPNFALSMFTHESSMGTAGTAVDTCSWGNTRSPSFGAVPYALIAGRSGSFPAFSTWLDGCISTVARLSSLVWPVDAPYGERTSIQQVFDHPSGAVWAPAGDLNDPAGYLNAMLTSMNRNSDQSPEAITATALVVPPVYQDYITVNYTTGRAGHVPSALVLHITAGASASSAIGWFKNPTSKVSSHYVIDRNGDIYAVVREQDQAWVNGIMEDENTDIPIISDWSKTGTNPNTESIGIEVAGYSSMQPSGQPPYLVGYTEAQFAALDYLLPVLSERWGIPIIPDLCFGHNEISGTQRVNCPGLSDSEWQRVYGMSVPDVPGGPYVTPDAAYDAFCAEHGDTIVWAGQVIDKQHWYGRDPQEVARTGGHRLLAYDGEYAIDATGWTMDEWENMALVNGQLTIWGQETAMPPPVIVPPTDPGPSLVGAAWPINPGDGAVSVATNVTLEWGSDAPTSDVEFDQSDGVRIFALQAHTSTAYGPLALAEATTYVWRVRGRDSGNTSDWTEARFGTAHPDPVHPEEPDKPPKPPSTEPYAPVVTPTHAEASTATTWRNVSDNKVDLAVSRQWRADCDGGTGPWPDTDQWLNSKFPGAGTARSPLELRALTRRLSIHPPIVEAGWRAGLWERVPATYVVDGSPWEDAASQDYGDDWGSMPAHAQHWAQQICTLATAIQHQTTLAQAIATLGFSAGEAQTWAGRYHCLRRRCRDLQEIASC
jgi:N-acetyl-anhydromuramyl-L-alanine amidase AmpD